MLTALLLLLLADRLGLPWTGQLSLLFYLTFDPIVQLMGSKAHLESFLTLTIPASLLLFALSRARNSLPLTLSAGVVFGLAFANRINEGVIVIAALAYTALRWRSRQTETQNVRSAISTDLLRLGCLCLVGWAVFILCFPPLWKSPLLGFVDFLSQQASSSGIGFRFQAPTDFLWGGSKLRFLFVLLSLAGICFKRGALFQTISARNVAVAVERIDCQPSGQVLAARSVFLASRTWPCRQLHSGLHPGALRETFRFPDQAAGGSFAASFDLACHFDHDSLLGRFSADSRVLRGVVRPGLQQDRSALVIVFLSPSGSRASGSHSAGTKLPWPPAAFLSGSPADGSSGTSPDQSRMDPRAHGKEIPL